MSDPLLRRVLVALSASRRSHALLEPAARLASRMGAELVGLFLEDEDLLRLASLPFAQLVAQSSSRLPIDRAAVERMLQRGRESARAALEKAVRHYDLRAEFRVMRSDLRRVFGDAAEAGDLIVLERGELGTVVSETLARCRASVLCLASTPSPPRSVVLRLAPSELVGARLGISAELAAAAGADLMVVLPGRDPATEQQVASVAERAGIRARLHFAARGREVADTPAADAVLVLSWAALEERRPSAGGGLASVSRSILLLP